MISSILLSVALLFPLPWARPAINASTYHVGHWTLTVQQDRFSDRRICQLTNGNVSIVRGAVVFHFPETVDTTQAVYRIDDGVPTEAAADTLSLAHAGFAIYSDDLTNPSGGLVRIPISKLLDAQTIRIAPGEGAPPRTYDVYGVRDAIERARLADCPDAPPAGDRP